MDEWKELKIDNLPSDILVGDYEFEWHNCVKWVRYEDRQPVLSILADLKTDRTRYRKRQPKPPTHEEIMTKWWHDEPARIWYKPVAYQKDHYASGEPAYVCASFGGFETGIEVSLIGWGKEWFLDKESADIPPEED